MIEEVSLATDDSAGDAGIGVDEIVSGTVYRVSDNDTAYSGFLQGVSRYLHV